MCSARTAVRCRSSTTSPSPLRPRYLSRCLSPAHRMLMSVVPGEGSSLSAAACRHLSWRFSWAKEMVDTSYELGFPLMAGSSLPVAWRMPPVDMPLGAEVEEVLGVGCEGFHLRVVLLQRVWADRAFVADGGVDSYDFHSLETIQCMA